MSKVFGENVLYHSALETKVPIKQESKYFCVYPPPPGMEEGRVIVRVWSGIGSSVTKSMQKSEQENKCM